jgi:hypothetical protein
MWEVNVYKDPEQRDAKKPKTEKLTVIAWNDVDVARKVGDRVAKPPKPLGHVWEDPATGEFHFIDNPTDGPTNKKAKPSVE